MASEEDELGNKFWAGENRRLVQHGRRDEIQTRTAAMERRGLSLSP